MNENIPEEGEEEKMSLFGLLKSMTAKRIGNHKLNTDQNFTTN